MAGKSSRSSEVADGRLRVPCSVEGNETNRIEKLSRAYARAALGESASASSARRGSRLVLFGATPGVNRCCAVGEKANCRFAVGRKHDSFKKMPKVSGGERHPTRRLIIAALACVRPRVMTTSRSGRHGSSENA